MRVLTILNSGIYTLRLEWLPYSGLFSLGANFPKLPEWTQSQLGKIYFGSSTDYGSLVELGATIMFL